MEMDDRIEDAARECIHDALGGERPYRRVIDFLVTLVVAKHWTPDEVEAVSFRACEQISMLN